MAQKRSTPVHGGTIEITRDTAYDKFSDAANLAAQNGTATIHFKDKDYKLVRAEDIEALQSMFMDLGESLTLSAQQISQGQAKGYTKQAFAAKFGHLEKHARPSK